MDALFLKQSVQTWPLFVYCRSFQMTNTVQINYK